MNNNFYSLLQTNKNNFEKYQKVEKIDLKNFIFPSKLKLRNTNIRNSLIFKRLNKFRYKNNLKFTDKNFIDISLNLSDEIKNISKQLGIKNQINFCCQILKNSQKYNEINYILYLLKEIIEKLNKKEILENIKEDFINSLFIAYNNNNNINNVYQDNFIYYFLVILENLTTFNFDNKINIYTSYLYSNKNFMNELINIIQNGKNLINIGEALIIIGNIIDDYHNCICYLNDESLTHKLAFYKLIINCLNNTNNIIELNNYDILWIVIWNFNQLIKYSNQDYIDLYFKNGMLNSFKIICGILNTDNIINTNNKLASECLEIIFNISQDKKNIEFILKDINICELIKNLIKNDLNDKNFFNNIFCIMANLTSFSNEYITKFNDLNIFSILQKFLINFFNYNKNFDNLDFLENLFQFIYNSLTFKSTRMNIIKYKIFEILLNNINLFYCNINLLKKLFETILNILELANNGNDRNRVYIEFFRLNIINICLENIKKIYNYNRFDDINKINDIAFYILKILTIIIEFSYSLVKNINIVLITYLEIKNTLENLNKKANINDKISVYIELILKKYYNKNNFYNYGNLM